jgi:EAL domain-containing protein (putative c-di-GMP-specific phosphodiesterase class I)
MASMRSPHVVFQPIVELDSDRVVGFEALSTGDALSLTLSALDEIPQPLLLTVNASPATVCSGRFLALVTDADTRRLIVELSEHDRVPDYEALARRVRELRSLGARMSVSDTGAGISTLPHVARIGPDIIKLDRSLAVAATSGGPLAAHARGVVSYAETVDVPVIADGIESEEQRRAMLDLGVTLGQGDHLAPPARLEYWVRRIRSHRAPAVA